MNPLRMTALAVLSTTLVAPGAQALELGNGFSLLGQVELEHYSFPTGGGGSLLLADLTLGWRSAADGALGFGIDLTADTFHNRTSGDTLTAYWGGLVLTTGLGDITLGAARPVYDTVYKFPEFGTGSDLNVGLLLHHGSLTSIYPLLADTIVSGASITGSAGALTYGASIHSGEGNTLPRLETAQIALSYVTGNVTLLGFFEDATIEGAPTSSTVQAGAIYDAGRLSLGVELAKRDGGGGSGTWSRLHAGYEVTDAITVTADAANYDDGLFTDSLWSLGAEYRFGTGGFIQAGATSGITGDSYDIGLGFRF